VVAATILAIESLVFIGVHVKYREIAPIILSGVLGLVMVFIAYGRMVLRPIISIHERRSQVPVPDEIAESNRVQTERLRMLVGLLDAEMLAIRLPNGWTVAVALAHIAFWDRQRLCLMRRWAAGNGCNGGYDGELFNEVLLPFLETIPPERAAEMALTTAEEVDAFLLTVPEFASR
jgi:hypothetical protein